MIPLPKYYLAAGLVMAALAIVWGGFVMAQPIYDIGAKSTPLVRDQQETISVYFNRAEFIPRHEFPYSHVLEEYPVLGVLYISLPRLFTQDPGGSMQIFSFMSLLVLCALVAVTSALLRFFKRSPWYLTLFLLPATLYFAFNRFDILIALIVQISLYMLVRRRYAWAIFLLAISFFVKWYGILFVPVYLVYMKNTVAPEVWRKSFRRMLRIIGITLVVPTVVLFIFAGVNSILPYAFHASRGIEYGNVLVPFLERMYRVLPPSLVRFLMKAIPQLLFAGQIILPLVMALNPSGFIQRIKSHRDVVRWMVIIVLLFLLFGKFYSPQFILWLLPLLILLVRRFSDILLFITLDLIHYLSFPLIYIQSGYNSDAYALMAFIRTLVYCIVLFKALPATRAWFPATSFVDTQEG